MLVIANSMQQLNWDAICMIYEEGFRLRAKNTFSHLPEAEGIWRAQQDTYQYLCNEFYAADGSYYAIWTDGEQWVSAVRMRVYSDGMLVDALETAPQYRGRGYGKELLRAVRSQLPPNTRVYSRVLRKNKASVRVHLACGFTVFKTYAKFLDGSFRSDADTYLYET